MDKECICAGIVTYLPDIQRLWENIDAVSGQVDRVFVVDNGSQNVDDIRNLTEQYLNVELIRNVRNEGIAHALNQIIAKAERDHYGWALTLDQDSVCHKELVRNYLRYIDGSMGMLICDIVDRNYEMKRKIPTDFLEDVEKCITSGCLTNVKAVIHAGGFDEKLFIDMVDYDMCHSLRKLGYRIVNMHFEGLLHEVGKSKKYHISGFAFVVNNHSAQRKYTITRNSVYLIKKHGLNPILEYAVVFRRIFTVLFFEDKKADKIRAILKGVWDGWKMQRDL